MALALPQPPDEADVRRVEVEQADRRPRGAELGYEALALTDHDGVYGSLEFAHAAKAFGVRPITGAEVTLADNSHVTLLVESPCCFACR